MATSGRQSDPSVTDSLYEKPLSFDFYQAVRLLHWLNDHAAPESRARDAVRFGSRLALEAPASEIYDLQRGAPAQPEQPAKPPRMTVNFLGLTGPAGALPMHYTETLLERRFRYRDRTLPGIPRYLQSPAHHAVLSVVAKYPFFIDWERRDPRRLPALPAGSHRTRHQRPARSPVAQRSRRQRWRHGLLRRHSGRALTFCRRTGRHPH